MMTTEQVMRKMDDALEHIAALALNKGEAILRKYNANEAEIAEQTELQRQHLRAWKEALLNEIRRTLEHWDAHPTVQ